MSPNSMLSNSQLAQIFNQIADLLEIKGEIVYKILAYRKAADSFTGLDRDVSDIWQEGKLLEVPGVGKAIAEKVDELFTTGQLGFFERLKLEVPISLIELLRVPDLGPKKVALFWKQVGITTLDELSSAAKAGKLSSLPGMGEKSEQKIIAGLEALARQSGRIPVSKAWLQFENLTSQLNKLPDVEKIAPAGSLRRRRDTVGDLDILVATRQPEIVMKTFVNIQDVIRIIGHGETKSSVEFSNGVRAQLWAVLPERFGTALQYATGSKDHNVRLRELALKRGLSLSEHALTRPDGSEILCSTEEEVYAALGLPWIPPELREDRGEVQAAQAGQLPDLIDQDDLVAELHTHSKWSDGKLTIAEMANEAISRGLKILAITDHSTGLGITGGLSVADIGRQREEMDAVQAAVGGKLLLLQGCEVEIMANGDLAFPDEALSLFDVVIASLHISLRQPSEKVTARLLNAVRNPHVDIIGHPTGRLIPDREGADLDMETVMQAAAESGVAMEINAHPARLDLDDINSRRAIALGIPLSINTDAHSASDLDLRHFGLGIARRSWAAAEHVINTWSKERLLDWLKDRHA